MSYFTDTASTPALTGLSNGPGVPAPPVQPGVTDDAGTVSSKEVRMVIFSFGLLVLAVVLLILAVVKSSVALGVAALGVTAAAGLILIGAYSYYRRRTAPEGPVMGYQPNQPAGGAYPGSSNGWSAGGPAPANGAVATLAPVLANYPDLTATQAAASADTYNLEEAYSMRRYELEHAGRKTVIAAIDRRIDSILDVQRRLRN